MKKSTLFLSSALLLASVDVRAQVPAFVSPTDLISHNLACIVASCVDSPVSIWIDPALVIATGLDLLATKDQGTKTVDAKDAVNELEDSLKGGCSGSGGAAQESSLSEADINVYAPEIVVSVLDDSADFYATREAVEDYAFETSDPEVNGACKEEGDRTDRECAVERQNVWTLLSVTLAESMADKMLASSADMSGRYSALVSHFNEQTSPMGMWGAMNSITVDSHMQMNDINALYARSLEVNAVAGLNEAGVRRLGRETAPSEAQE